MFTYRQNLNSGKRAEPDLRSEISAHSELNADKAAEILSEAVAPESLEICDDMLLINSLSDCCVLAYRSRHTALGTLLEEITSALERLQLQRTVR